MKMGVVAELTTKFQTISTFPSEGHKLHFCCLHCDSLKRGRMIQVPSSECTALLLCSFHQSHRYQHQPDQHIRIKCNTKHHEHKTTTNHWDAKQTEVKYACIEETSIETYAELSLQLFHLEWIWPGLSMC